MKKLSIVLTIALVVALAVPAMAASNLKVNGNFEVESVKTKDADTESGGYLELYLEANPAENVTFYSEVDFGYDFDQNNYSTTGTSEVYEAYINVDDAFGPVDLKAGRMFEAAADSMLYEFDSGEFARLAYDNANVSAKFGHNLDTDSQGKVIFAEGKVTGLGLVDAVTLNYVDANAADYDGYTVKATKSHSFGTGSVLLGKANDAQVVDVSFETAQLLPGATASFEYATAEAGFARSEYKDTDGNGDNEVVTTNQDSVITDSKLAAIGDDVTMIKPGVSFNVTDKLGVDLSYAMYEADKLDAEDAYLDIVGSYDLAKDTYLEVEYEDHAVDGADASANNVTDETVITTTLGVNF
ncbi:MAG: hypothetical protein AWU54_1849 [Candidatus Frackibacter sp. T328-2]|nr:MAG: hypothetical protein AWU54_1849 [Candidatus Frackibacter sp. T328-2]